MQSSYAEAVAWLRLSGSKRHVKLAAHDRDPVHLRSCDLRRPPCRLRHRNFRAGSDRFGLFSITSP